VSYLTPNSLSGSTSLVLTIPDDVLLKAAIVGAITPLVFADNWEPYGSQTPQDTAAALAAIVDQLSWGEPAAGGGITLSHSIVHLPSNQSINVGVTTLNFTDVIQDDTGLWDAVNSRFEIASDGVYLVRLAAAIADLRQIKLATVVNGTSYYWMTATEGSSFVPATGSMMPLTLTAGDTLTAAINTSGVSSVLYAGTPVTSFELVSFS